MMPLHKINNKILLKHDIQQFCNILFNLDDIASIAFRHSHKIYIHSQFAIQTPGSGNEEAETSDGVMFYLDT